VSAAPLRLIYGGTFDPVHRGHVAIAEGARQALLAAGLELDRFDFLPNADPPHRDAPGANAGHRVAMLWLALQGQPQFGIDLREVRRGGASYMVDTLAELRGQVGPHAPLALLLGADAFSGLDRWQRWTRLPELAHLLVVERPDAPGSPLSPQLAALAHARTSDPSTLAARAAGAIVRLALPPHPASSTAVRKALECGCHADAAELLEPAVLAYIQRHGLYAPRALG
jgi:nicotinate-nucleotide adenylyltransferase